MIYYRSENLGMLELDILVSNFVKRNINEWNL